MSTHRTEKYRVPVRTVATMWVEVEAEGFDEAMDKTFDAVESMTLPRLPFTLDDWELSDAEYYVDGEPVE